MDEALRQKLRSTNAATDAAIAEATAVRQLEERAAREEQSRTAEAERNLCITAERISNNWLEPLVRDFAKEVQAGEIDSTYGGSGDGFAQDSRRKACRISGMNGDYESALIVTLYVVSESALSVTVDYQSRERAGVGTQVSEHFPLTLFGSLLGLTDAEAAKQWTQSALVDAYGSMRRAAAGLK